VKELWARIRAQIDQRSPRERWILALGGTVVVLFLCHWAVIGPLGRHAAAAEKRASELDDQLLRARRLAAEIRGLQGQLTAVESRIQSQGSTNLLALIETAAARSGIQKDQVESIKPTPVSGNTRYPETKVTVSLRGTTLDQMLHFLHAIETADAHLIMRTLQLRRARLKGGGQALDVTLSVSSFDRGR
jgi:general secretion pathway protein M